MEKKKARKPKRVTRESREENEEAGAARAARESREAREAPPTEMECRANETPTERDVFAGETEADLDAIIEGRIEERTSAESQTKHEQETRKQEELLAQEMEKTKRKERLKRARDMRFRTGESETSIPKANERQQSSCLVNNLHDCSLSSTRMPRNIDSGEDSEVDLLLNEDFDFDDDDEEDVQQPAQQGADTIKAKMDFLKFFEIPSLSDISEECDEATNAVTVRPNYKYMEHIEEGYEEYEEEDEGEGEVEQDTLRFPAGVDTIRAKMDFLGHFAIPTLSDISED